MQIPGVLACELSGDLLVCTAAIMMLHKIASLSPVAEHFVDHRLCIGQHGAHRRGATSEYYAATNGHGGNLLKGDITSLGNVCCCGNVVSAEINVGIAVGNDRVAIVAIAVLKLRFALDHQRYGDGAA